MAQVDVRSGIAAQQERGALWPAGPVEGEERAPWGWLVLLTAVAAALRGFALDQQLWYDEMAALLDSVRQPLGTILTTYNSQNQHTLYSLLARVSIILLGDHPWTLRLPAAAFGVAAVPMLYFCARLMARQREALLAATLLGVSYHHVWFSQNGRGYTGLVFFTLLTTYFFIRGARETRPGLWLAYGVATALGMYTHLTMGFIAAGQGLVYLWLLATRAKQAGGWTRGALAPLGGFAVAAAITLLLYAPILSQLLTRTVGQAGAAAVRSEWTNPVWLALETLRGLGAGGGGVAAAGAIGVAGLVAVLGLASTWRAERYFVGLIVFPAIVTGAVLLALGHNLWPRFFFFAIGFAFLLLVRGAMVWGEWAARLLDGDERAGLRWGTALAGLMLLASLGPLRAAYLYPKQDFLGAMAYVDAERRPGEVVLVAGLARLPYQRYYARDWAAVETREQLETARADGQGAWLLYASPIFLESRQPELWNTIQSEFTTVRVFRGTLGGGEVYVCRANDR